MNRPTVAEINLKAIVFNFNQIKKLVGEGVKICPAVKADAYGHGAVEISRTVLNAGADMLGVATLEEGVELREGGITAPILLLQCFFTNQIPSIVENGISAMICDCGLAEELSNQALKAGKRIKVHVKVDTGMGRVGVQQQEIVKFTQMISQLPGIEIEGLFTHFPAADDDLNFTYRQIEDFERIAKAAESGGVHIPIKHAANSAAILNVPESYFDMVRPGIMLYGLYDSENVLNAVELRQSLALKSQVVFLKKLPAGKSVSYGRTYITSRETIVATIPIGYADGYNRLLSNKAHVLIKGVRAPVMGRVCMDQIMADVTDIPNVKIGDEVALYGSQGGETISIEEIAKLQGTITNEVICAISKRVPRVYIP